MIETYDPVTEELGPDWRCEWRERFRITTTNPFRLRPYLRYLLSLGYDPDVSIAVTKEPNRRGGQDYPPVALGRLDDRSGWRWLDAKPDGWLDWTLTVLLVAVACVPFLLIYCPLCWALRAITRKAGA